MRERARRLPVGAAPISCAPPPPQTKAGRRGLACCVHTNMEARLAPREPAHAQRRQPDVTACFAPSFPGMPPSSRSSSSSRHPSCVCRNSAAALLAPCFDPRNAAAARLCMFDLLGVRAHSATAALLCVPRHTGRLAAARQVVCLFAWSSKLLLFPILSARSRRSRPAGLRARRRRGFSRFLFLAPRGFPPPPFPPHSHGLMISSGVEASEAAALGKLLRQLLGAVPCLLAKIAQGRSRF